MAIGEFEKLTGSVTCSTPYAASSALVPSSWRQHAKWVAGTRHAFGAGLLAIMAFSSGGAAQDVSGMTTKTGDASRTQLMEMAAQAEQIASSSSAKPGVRKMREAEAQALHERLREGDFREGDRFYLSVAGEKELTDTFTVRAERLALLPNVGEVSLRGVLRSELQDYMKAQIGRFIRDPQVRAYALIRMYVTGAVRNTGFFNVPSDILMSDLLMRAGGPNPNADLQKTQVQRASKPVVSAAVTSWAITEGRTLDQLSLRSGDAVVVAEKRSRNWEDILRYVSVAAGAILGIYGIAQIVK